MMVGPRSLTLLETGTRADGDSKSEFSAGTTREPLHKSTTPHPALRATLSRWERDGVVRAFSLWEKVPEGRMRGGVNLVFGILVDCAQLLRRRQCSGHGLVDLTRGQHEAAQHPGVLAMPVRAVVADRIGHRQRRGRKEPGVVDQVREKCFCRPCQHVQ